MVVNQHSPVKVHGAVQTGTLYIRSKISLTMVTARGLVRSRMTGIKMKYPSHVGE